MDFRQYARQPDHQLNLVTGALLIARDAHPSLVLAEQMQRIAELSAPLSDVPLISLCPFEQAKVLADHLYGVCGFRGNDQDYYDPKNSFLNDVLDRRVGIPISLAVLYVAVAERAGVRAAGVNFPGHFLVRIDGQGPSVFVDPFHGGGLLDQEALRTLWTRVTGSSDPVDDGALGPAGVRMTLVRMLMNLRGIYANRGDYQALLVVLDRLVDLAPDPVQEIRDRGLIAAKLGAPAAALADLSRYIESAPDAGDASEVRRVMDQLSDKSSHALN